MPVFKVWSADRAKRVSVVASGCEDLIAKGNSQPVCVNLKVKRVV